jgi:hypothetical protein
MQDDGEDRKYIERKRCNKVEKRNLIYFLLYHFWYFFLDSYCPLFWLIPSVLQYFQMGSLAGAAHL